MVAVQRQPDRSPLPHPRPRSLLVSGITPDQELIVDRLSLPAPSGLVQVVGLCGRLLRFQRANQRALHQARRWRRLLGRRPHRPLVALLQKLANNTLRLGHFLTVYLALHRLHLIQLPFRLFGDGGVQLCRAPQIRPRLLMVPQMDVALAPSEERLHTLLLDVHQYLRALSLCLDPPAKLHQYQRPVQRQRLLALPDALVPLRCLFVCMPRHSQFLRFQHIHQIRASLVVVHGSQ
mmetsp:Transcript_170373/g.541160  ORF Transcript_170373/g.541160 Transcript_170373/m.541160 type:complete len:235 (+) Transcript_170373:53-757(+)